MKVLHLLRSNVFSGAENVVCQIIKFFSKTDIQMVYTSPKGPIQEALAEKNIDYLSLEKLGITETMKLVQEYSPDVVHAHDVTASIVAALACPKSIRIISHIHVNHANMAKINVKTLLYHSFSKRFDKIIWVSDSCYKEYRFKDKIAQKSIVLANVVDGEDIQKRSELVKTENYDIIYVGRLTAQKNPLKLLDVLERVIVKQSDVKIAVIGSGDMKEKVLEVAKEKKLLRHITFYDFILNPLPYLKNAKVMVMTSKFEGLPMVALESLALGTPVVSTPVDGLKEVVENGLNGFLAEDSQALADKIFEIVSDEALRERLSKGAAKNFEKINDIANYRNQLDRIYRKYDG
ncbi:glycosyltransferase [Streptococcus respiraculi]|uniref:glycosyltransferase n=1 Tax=Streptococcus respiraculi TaxID=2021971 RepID=UPI000E73FC4D|nr:glycosyltransferase [Streptococcus respiraculi]